MHKCEVCEKPDEKKPMCFRGERWCSEAHRQVVLKDVPVARRRW